LSGLQFARMSDEERRRVWEEEQKAKKVLEVGLKGRVKWYSVLGHYGFIARADGKPDIFVHQSAISKSQTEKFYLRTLADDEPVEFDIVEGRKGPEASNVTGPNGGNVRGSRRLLCRFDQYGRHFRPRRNRQPRGEGAVEPTDGVEATTDVEAGITVKPSPKRRSNYYSRRFRRQKVGPKQGDDVGNEVLYQFHMLNIA
uniref:CSD_1 domain-containing protein n=1 Tax=Angiostrongylus cantonensis TaxID=6313 RepID=A0A0K0DGB1_ANGCA